MKGLKLEPVVGYLRENARIARVAGLTLLVVAFSLWTWMSTRDTIAELNAETDRAAAARQSADEFSNRFLPATVAETDEWARTAAAAAEYGVPAESRLSLAGSVSRIAEGAGLSGVMVRFVGTAPEAPPRLLGDIVFQPAQFGLTLEGSGSALAVARAALRLPPPVEIAGVTLTGDSDQMRATFTLAVYLSPGGPND